MFSSFGFADPYATAPRPSNRRFNEYFRCYSISMLPGPPRPSLNHGGKLILPSTALDKLTRLNISYPMLFELENASTGLKTHAGVLEFIAEEGRVYMPWWIMVRLGLDQGDLVNLRSTTLMLGTFVKLQPQSVDFLDISDPKAVLESALRNFSCLTKGDVFSIEYNEHEYHIAVLSVKPGPSEPETDDDEDSDIEELDPPPGISVVETDLSVDFAPPIGYVEPTPQSRGSNGASGTSTPASTSGQGSMHARLDFARLAATNSGRASPFAGTGQKLSGKAVQEGHKVHDAAIKAQAGKPEDRGAPAPLRLPFGQLFFGYEVVPVKKSGEAEGEVEVKFWGEGQSLRGKKKGADTAVKKEKEEEKAKPRVVGRTLGGKEVTEID
ncbi:UFD1-domain-containing protein [Saitoella complicata NRRL Y-17804]|uniref:UFD1-domain-containing protein n=1 Tax=Saitoella complicata (strain BCRC 22490 / CBS 7301 / JCM 7358 / NBRC 10748 / NRRL Y-17804) TaxID=698492 RepID=UPI000866F15F|nr:UFD1-domain-containing protein [Saitoella complicata NRRL Y-17804]ODQ53091.1 UFD1-domain-containing protein [Saitoella complicata NRRL Y-17804]